MSQRGLSENLVARINPIDAREYAKASGWQRVSNVHGKLAVYAHPSSDLDQLLIPLDSGLVDHGRLMAEVVANLAEAEGRAATEVLNDLLMPPSDVLRFRIEEPETASGILPLSRGIELLRGARRALLSAACSVDHPRPFHPRLSRAEAEQLLQRCRLGQTERGSFTAVIACPLDAVDAEPIRPQPMPLFEGRADSKEEDSPPSTPAGPFTRKATSLLMRSVAGIVEAVDADRVATLLEPEGDQPQVSANLCEALVMMRPIGDRSRLTLSATWARTLPPPPSAMPPSTVHLKHDDFPVVERLSIALRPAREPRKSRFVALVDALLGNPDERNRVSGEVQLLVLDGEEGSFKARVNLDADDYQVAWIAHGQAGYVSLNGILNPGGRLHRIETVTNFKRLDD